MKKKVFFILSSENKIIEFYHFDLLAKEFTISRIFLSILFNHIECD